MAMEREKMMTWEGWYGGYCEGWNFIGPRHVYTWKYDWSRGPYPTKVLFGSFSVKTCMDIAI